MTPAGANTSTTRAGAQRRDRGKYARALALAEALPARARAGDRRAPRATGLEQERVLAVAFRLLDSRLLASGRRDTSSGTAVAD